MLRSMKDLDSYMISATDGNVGHVKDFLFDDHAWVVRYFVVETGTWLSSRKVLISPIAVHDSEWSEKTLPVWITMEQVRNSPDVDTDKPVSRQYESDYLGYYGYPYYWDGEGLWGGGMYPYAMFPGHVINGAAIGGLRDVDRAYASAQKNRHQNDDPNLRSCNAVSGYRILTNDGGIGHVSGFLVDDSTWALRYMIVDTSNWWLGHKVLIAPEWIDEVSWTDQTVSIDLNRQAIRAAPAYDSSVQLSRRLERNLYHHYNRSGYWPEDARDESEMADA